MFTALLMASIVLILALGFIAARALFRFFIAALGAAKRGGA